MRKSWSTEEQIVAALQLANSTSRCGSTGPRTSRRRSWTGPGSLRQSGARPRDELTRRPRGGLLRHPDRREDIPCAAPGKSSHHQLAIGLLCDRISSMRVSSAGIDSVVEPRLERIS